MVFSSHFFLYYFLPLALGLYFLAPKKLKHLVLTGLSYGFYGWSNPAFMALMVTSTVIDYFCGRAIVGADERLEPGTPRSRKQKTAVTISIVANLALLGFFKYFHFAVDSYNGIASALGLPAAALDNTLRVVLPLGISFYTFQSMSYTIDVYRGHARVLTNFIDFACFVSMFPQLVAGPILRFSEISEQLRSRTHTLAKFARGAACISLGMGKKVLLANPCGRVADFAFDAGVVDTATAWLGAVAYAFQIYFDFSGYSDMAIGLGLMLGFRFPKNFDSPYHSKSITEFWRRWHLSLSTWLRDYLYIPLGGNRLGIWKTYRNLALVMLLGGLWHGAAWTFVAWGAAHGTLLAIERARGGRALWSFLPQRLHMAATFIVVLFTWVLFRADSIGRAGNYLASMVGLGTPSAATPILQSLMLRPYYLVTLAVAALVTWLGMQTTDWTRQLDWRKVALAGVALVVSAITLETQDYNPFIYFIF